jgi:hypothetical protein
MVHARNLYEPWRIDPDMRVTLVYYRLVGPPREQVFGVTIRE